MKRTIAIALAAAVLVIGASARAEPAYHQCTITHGQVFSCDGAWYQGKAVARR